MILLNNFFQKLNNRTIIVVGEHGKQGAENRIK